MKTRAEEYEERRQRKTKIIVTIVMLAVMVFSSLAYAALYLVGDVGTSNKYNGFKINPVSDQNSNVVGYTVKLQGADRYFYTQPQDSLSIAFPTGFAAALRSAPGIVLLFDPKDNLTPVYDQIRFSFSQDLTVPQASAVTSADTVYKLPVYNCSAQNTQYITILLQQGNRSIYQNGSCTVLAGTTGTDFALLHDRIVYAYYGVTQE